MDAADDGDAATGYRVCCIGGRHYDAAEPSLNGGFLGGSNAAARLRRCCHAYEPEPRCGEQYRNTYGSLAVPGCLPTVAESSRWLELCRFRHSREEEVRETP